MNRRVISGFVLSIDSFEEDGTPLNDSPLEDRRAILAEDDDGREMLGADQTTTVVTLEFLERRDRLDRQRYSL